MLLCVPRWDYRGGGAVILGRRVLSCLHAHDRPEDTRTTREALASGSGWPQVTLAPRIQHHALVIGHSLSARRRTAGHAGRAGTRASDHAHASVCSRCYPSMQPHASRAMPRMRRARRHGQHGRQSSDDGGGGDGSDDNSGDGSGSSGSSARWRRRGRDQPPTPPTQPLSLRIDRVGHGAAGGGAGRGCGGATDDWLGGSAPRDDVRGGGGGGGGAAADPEPDSESDTATAPTAACQSGGVLSSGRGVACTRRGMGS